jgi:DNA-binding CsgD family transcriptional regulator
VSELEQFSRLIEAIYDAALDDTRWHDLAGQFATLFNVHSCALQVRDAHGDMTLLGVTDNVTSDRLMHEYQQHYYKVDLWALAAMDLPHRGQSNIAVTEEQLGISKKVILRNEIYDFHHQTDMWHLIGASLELGGGANGIIGIHGGRKAEPFDETALDKLNLLLPHLRRAFQIRATLREHSIQRDISMEALDALAGSVLLVDEQGRLVYANRSGSALLRTGQGLAVRDGFVIAAHSAHADALARAISHACASTTQAPDEKSENVICLPRPGQTPLEVTVTRVRPGDLSATRDAPMAMLVARADDPLAASRDTLRTSFRLSQSEAELACLLAEGLNLDEIAVQRNVSLNTVRSQLKATFHKTGVRRQSELVTLVLKNGFGRHA